MADATLTEALTHPKSIPGTGVDFDLHGIVGLRVVGGDDAEHATIVRQVGPIERPLDRAPDIVVRFVDRLETTGRIRYLGLDDAGFTDDAFLVLRAKHKARARVRIPFEKIGDRCEIVCERGLPAVPHLIAIINLTALAKGALPLHASAFRWEGTDVLTTGWAKGGKTESLLAFMTRGAEYVGDEWIYLDADGRTMHGIPEPIRLWKWHLDEVPGIRRKLGITDRVRLGSLAAVIRALDAASDGSDGFSRLLRRVTPLLRRQAYVQLPPKFMFGDEKIALRGSPQKVFFMGSHETPDIRIEPMAAREIADRMVFSLQEERIELLAAYHRFRFAFPELRNELLEGAEDLQRAALLRALDGKETWAAWHPYPVSIPALYDAMRPYVERS